MNRIMMLLAVAAFALIASACSIDVERNEDGSFQVQTVLTEESLATELARGIDDEEFESATVDMKDGYALVELQGAGENGRTDTFSFRVELFVVDGHLGADLTEAEWNDISIPQEMVEIWNEEISRDLEESAKEDPNSTLISVNLSENALTMEFRIEDEG